MDLILSDPRLRIDQYLRDVDTIVAEGGAVSDAFGRIRAGWSAATTDSTAEELERKILAAIATGDAVVVEQAMTAAAVATITRSPIRGRVARGILPALRSAYASSAGDNFRIVAERYDEAAGRLTACASATDVTAEAERIVALSAKERAGWMDAAVIAAELDVLLAALVNAANLAGISTTDNSGARLTGSLIALATDPGASHRRRVFEAWVSKGRCGRWAALLSLGVKLRAATLDGFEAYREPRPLEVRQQRSGMGTRQYTIDPEDQDYQPVSTDSDTPAEIARAKAGVDAWSKLGKSKATR